MLISSSSLRFLILIVPYILGRYAGVDFSGRKIGFTHFFTPYVLELKPEKQQLIVTKRNWFLLGVDRKSFNYGQIRNVLIDEHLFLGDIEIRVYAGKINCYWMRKKQLRAFESKLLALKRSKYDLEVIDDV